MAIRKDANTLTSGERNEFVSAVLELKARGIYDRFVLRHANAIMTAIHRCPAFLPWHRRYLWDLERELQRVSGNPNLGIPYWNWPEGGANASMWDDDLLGGDGEAGSGAVLIGPFRSGQWTVVDRGGQPSGPLRRQLGQGVPSLPTQDDIDFVLAQTPYDSLPWNANSQNGVRNLIEGWSGPNLHNRGHVWVGGSMLPMTSPNDPVFFMHHCMVDKVWHEWQLRFPDQGYLPVSGGPFGQNLTDPMNNTPAGPIGDRPFDVLDSAALDIEYDQLMRDTPQPPTPPTGDGAESLIINGPVINDSIATPGEIRRYRLEVPEFGQYRIETFGSSDTFLTLFGPADDRLEVASDDDSGANLNARLEMGLSAGSYLAQVRLYSPNQTGSYTIAATATGNNTSLPELVLDGAATEAAISLANESDTYRFSIINTGDYIIEGHGSTDIFLTVSGPDDQTATIASDDDSGAGLNPRLRLRLQPGEYFARVRHFSANGTGSYGLSLRSD